MAAEESDYDYALRLHQELNGIVHPVIPTIGVNGNNVKIPERSVSFGSVIVLSDSECSNSDEENNPQACARAPAPAKASHSRHRSRSPISCKTENVTVDNQQAITVRSLNVFT